MAKKRTSGLRKESNIWYIDKVICGQRIHKSTGTSNYEEAELILSRLITEKRKVAVLGEHKARTFNEAAEKWMSLDENREKKSFKTSLIYIKQLEPYIGSIEIDKIHNDSFRAYIDKRKQAGVKNKTINSALEIARRILNACAKKFRDDITGRAWLETPPSISLLHLKDAAKPYPLSWDEQERLFKLMPKHLRKMATFKVNTGLRDQELCQLRWEWELYLPEFERSIFVIPGGNDADLGAAFEEDEITDLWQGTKNGDDRLVVLNTEAQVIIENCRGDHEDFVFTYFSKPISSMHNSAWKTAWEKAGLPTGRHVKKGVHNLRHTFARRLRAMGVSKETRATLLGHRNDDITTHYSLPELQELIDAVDKLMEAKSKSVTMIRVIRHPGKKQLDVQSPKSPRLGF